MSPNRFPLFRRYGNSLPSSFNVVVSSPESTRLVHLCRFRVRYHIETGGDSNLNDLKSSQFRRLLHGFSWTHLSHCFYPVCYLPQAVSSIMHASITIHVDWMCLGAENNSTLNYQNGRNPWTYGDHGYTWFSLLMPAYSLLEPSQGLTTTAPMAYKTLRYFFCVSLKDNLVHFKWTTYFS